MQVTNAKVIAIIGRGCLTYLVSKNKQVRVWHQQLDHANNTGIIKTSKLLSGMGNFNNKYDPSEIYSNSKYEDSNDSTSKYHPTINTPLVDIFSLPETLNTNNIKSVQANKDFDSLCSPCIASKQSRVTVYKLMTEVKEKLEEVYIDL